MDLEIKKKIKDLDCIIAILTFGCTVVFIAALGIGILLIKQIYFK